MYVITVLYHSEKTILSVQALRNNVRLKLKTHFLKHRIPQNVNIIQTDARSRVLANWWNPTIASDNVHSMQIFVRMFLSLSSTRKCSWRQIKKCSKDDLVRSYLLRTGTVWVYIYILLYRYSVTWPKRNSYTSTSITLSPQPCRPPVTSFIALDTS